MRSSHKQRSLAFAKRHLHAWKVSIEASRFERAPTHVRTRRALAPNWPQLIAAHAQWKTSLSPGSDDNASSGGKANYQNMSKTMFSGRCAAAVSDPLLITAKIVSRNSFFSQFRYLTFAIILATFILLTIVLNKELIVFYIT